MARGEDNDNTIGRERWRSLVPALVWIIKRIEMSPPDAERIANSPEMKPKIEWALRKLKNEVHKELYKVFVLEEAWSWPINKFRILWGGCYIDLLDVFQPLPGVTSDIQAIAIREFLTGVRWPDIEYNSDWLKHVFPADASAQAANTEAPVAEPEQAARAEESMPEPASPVEPEPAPPTEPPHVEPVPLSPKPLAQELPPEKAEQQGPPLLLSDKPQFEEPRKWRPKDVKEWFKYVRKIDPQKPEENNSDYARRLHGRMAKDFENPPWGEAETLRRRLNDPDYD
jgi:hypothetical protein